MTRLLWKAYYYDGKTAERHACEVTLTPEVCRVTVGGRAMDWPWKELTQTQGQNSGEPVRLERGDESVIVGGEGFLKAVFEVAPGARSRLREPSRPARGLVAAALAFLITAAVGAVVYFWVVPRASAFAAEKVPPSFEEKLGDTFVGSFLDVMPECDSEEAERSVDEILGRLEAAAPPNPYTFEVYILDDEMVNAMAAPGGRIIVFTGLLEATDSPEELAGVLAHEMEHVLQKHVTRSMFQEMSTGMLMSLVLGDFQGASRAVQTIGNLRYSRITEEEADRLGTGLLVKAGIGTRGMAEFFEKLSHRKTLMPIKYLSTHPAPDERAANIKKYSAGAPENPEPLLPGTDWGKVKKSCSKKGDAQNGAEPKNCSESPQSYTDYQRFWDPGCVEKSASSAQPPDNKTVHGQGQQGLID